MNHTEADWLEDSHLENGNYMNLCVICEEDFIGHKRRVVCKRCVAPKRIKNRMSTRWYVWTTAFAVLAWWLFMSRMMGWW